jgi:hypothetical protein
MSIHVTTTAPGTRKRRSIVSRTLSALTACTGFACLALLTTAGTANAGEPPEPTWSVPVQLPGRPNAATGAATDDGISGGLDATSVALGALGGIAVGGAGLGVSLAVQRRRDHTALHSA